ncbi:MAG: hypothetical protein BJ554DRAFT_2109 [Olpidium bornovanus]|uniref:Uncharacterized protein n=1 Tax=Olpidium bornovanus TaxID=278681 RepID=A0A8H8A1N4_9FUNG|nr:MAG: hypothetical protein BJ554DRAFT_2109 [Olpidium bornovanus]
MAEGGHGGGIPVAVMAKAVPMTEGAGLLDEVHKPALAASLPDHRVGRQMAEFGLASPWGMRELHEYLAKPALRRNLEGLTLRTKCSARGLCRQFLAYFEAFDSCLSEELVAFHGAFPDAPPPMWVTHDYQAGCFWSAGFESGRAALISRHSPLQPRMHINHDANHLCLTYCTEHGASWRRTH